MPYTMEQYVSEVVTRLPRYDVAQSLDPGMLEMLVNRARHDVQMATLQMFPERYSRDFVISSAPAEVTTLRTAYSRLNATTGNIVTTLNTVYEASLPGDYIDVVAVRVDNGAGVLYAARRVDKRELYTTMSKGFTVPTTTAPIFYIEKSPAEAAYRIGVSKGASAVTAGQVEIWYLAKLPYMKLTSPGPELEVRIGYDLQELVVMVSCLKAVETVGNGMAIQMLQSDVEDCVRSLESAYEGSVDRSQLLTQARESVELNTPVI